MTGCKGDDQAFPNRPGLVGGLTKREYFAGLALQGLLVEVNCPEPFLTAAKMAVVSADYLIAELNRKAGE